MRVSFDTLQQTFNDILLQLCFAAGKAQLCSRIFAENSRDGVYSHGLNRFPVFTKAVIDGDVDINAEPECTGRTGAVEHWSGNSGPGMYIATRATERAVQLAKEQGIGCVAVKNTNHWMRGGTYGWQAAGAGCIAICSTNTIANMPPWGGSRPALGNNPLVIAIPREGGHLVLDMAMSQFSYGKLGEYELNGRQLPVAGGYDKRGQLTTDPATIRQTGRSLPVGFWKGSGLSFMLDVLAASLSGGQSVGSITASGKETNISQFFLCINAAQLDKAVIENIIYYTKAADPTGPDIRYPGEGTLRTRQENEKLGIPVNEKIWQDVITMRETLSINGH